MPWRMILVIVIILLVGIFAGFNLNQTNISIGFYVFENVPVFLALIISFILGAGMMIPFTLKMKISKKQEEKILKKKAKEEDKAMKTQKNDNIPDVEPVKKNKKKKEKK